MNEPKRDRFCGVMEDTILLTDAEVASPDLHNIMAEKRRLIDSGVSPLDLRDLASWKQAHPDAA